MFNATARKRGARRVRFKRPYGATWTRGGTPLTTGLRRVARVQPCLTARERTCRNVGRWEGVRPVRGACHGATGASPWLGRRRSVQSPVGASEIQTPLRGCMAEGGTPLTTGLRRVAGVQPCLPARARG